MKDTKKSYAIFAKNKKSSIIKNSILIFLILLVCYLLRASLKEALIKISETKFHVVLIIMVLSIMYQIFDGCIVTKTLRTCDNTFSYKNGIRCSYYYSFFRVVTFGSGTALAGMYYANKYGIPLHNSFGIFTLNYMFQKVVITIYFLVAYVLNIGIMKRMYSSFNRYILMGTLISSVVAISLITICTCERVHLLIFNIFDKFIKNDRFLNKIGDLKEKSGLLRKSSKEILKNKRLVISLIILNVIKLTCWYMIPFIILKDEAEVHFFISIVFSSMVTALSGIIPCPGGVGSTEFVILLVFAPLVGKTSALSLAILYRAFTYLFPFIIGIFTIKSS